MQKEGQDCTPEDVIDYLEDHVAKWWLPDAVEFVDDIPHTATGKISKKDLRERFSDYTLPEAVAAEEPAPEPEMAAAPASANLSPATEVQNGDAPAEGDGKKRGVFGRMFGKD